jgi:hypothetical protein
VSWPDHGSNDEGEGMIFQGRMNCKQDEVFLFFISMRTGVFGAFGLKREREREAEEEWGRGWFISSCLHDEYPLFISFYAGCTWQRIEEQDDESRE